MQPKYQELSTATSIEEIVDVTRAYLATWSSEELERLPDACRPGRVKSAADIEMWADLLSGQSAATSLFLDDVMRFKGQRVVAVVADSVRAAEEGCRNVVVEYEVLPAVFDPEEAMAPGAPQLHGSDDPFVHDPERNILLEIHGDVGDVEAGFAEADVIHEGTYSTPRVQHAHLETHGSIAWMEDGRLNVRTSSQSPSIAKVS